MTLTQSGTGGASLGFDSTVLLDGVPGGIAFVPASTPLISLNYYDGRFLKADDLNLERRAQRAYTDFSNRAGGPGLVNGFDVSIGPGATLRLSDGLAIDAAGRVLFLPESVSVTVTDLLAAATAAGTPMPGAAGAPGFAPCEVTTATAPTPVVAGNQIYLVAIAHTEGLCGNAEVFGRLCDDACVTATDRPYVLDGVVLLLVPLSLTTPLVTSSAVTLTDLHLRSRVASAYFADEWSAGGSLLSAAGLGSNVWCQGAPPLVGDIVPVGVLGWKGTTVAFLDEWTARRERMETPPRQYWQGRMEMRPWATFLAQVLQFQCQLAGLVTSPQTPDPGGDDACDQARELLGESTLMMEGLVEQLAALGWNPDDNTDADGQVFAQGLAQFELFKSKVASVIQAGASSSGGNARILVDGGICQLPAAGYLPVDPLGKLTIREQVQRLMGSGVDLRLCAVRRDQIAHELERAQHMDRISLLQGLDDPTDLENVDILVPDGRVVEHTSALTGIGLDIDLTFGVHLKESKDEAAEASDAPLDFEKRGPSSGFVSEAVRDPKRLPIRGAGRIDWGTDGIKASFAGAGAADEGMATLLRMLVGITDEAKGRGENVKKYQKISFGTGEPSLDGLQRMARTVEQLSVQHRATKRQARVVSLGDGAKNPYVAVGATGWTSANPFEMAIGDAATVSATLDMFMPLQRSLALSIAIDGRIDVVSSDVTARGLVVGLRLTGWFSGDGVNLHEGDGARRFVTVFKLALQVADGRYVVLLGNEDEDDWVALTAWQGTPIEAKAALIVRDSSKGSPAHRGPVLHDEAEEAARVAAAESNPGAGNIPGPPLGAPRQTVRGPEAMAGQHLFDAIGVQDDLINTPGNPFHDYAVAALGILQGAHPDEPGWVDEAASALFPSTTITTTEIVPTADWVLFRRRRREDCGDEVSTPVAPSRVAAWVALAKTEDEAAHYASIMPSGSVSKVPWTRIDIVDFEQTTANLRTSGQSLRSAYQQVGGGELLRFAGYASNGLGDPVGVTRASAVASALIPAATLDQAAIIDVVPQPPGEQMVAGTDASVFLISYDPPDPPAAHTDCIEIIGVNTMTEGGPALAEALLGGDEVAVGEILAEHPDLVFPLGSVEVDLVSGAVGDVAPSSQLLEELLVKLGDNGNDDDGSMLVPVGVGWIASDQTDDEKAQASVDIEIIARALPASLSAPLGTVIEADFFDPQRCRNRLYVTVYLAELN